MQRHSLFGTIAAQGFDFACRNLAPIVLFERRQCFRLARNGQSTAGEAGDGHTNQAGDYTAVEAIARLLRNAALFFHPTGAAARYVGSLQIFFRERLAGLEQFHHGLGQLRAGGPGFIDSRAGEYVRRARPLAHARIAIARQVGLAALARFLQRLGAPGAQRAAFHIPPDVRMQEEMLQIAVGGAGRILEPGRNKDAGRSDTVRMDVEEAENLGFRIAEGVKYRAGLERAGIGQVDHHLHAHGPLARMVAGGHAEFPVQLAADRADRAIPHHSEGRPYVHARHETGFRIALLIDALVGDAHASDAPVFDQRVRHGASRPNLHGPGHHERLPHPLVELADGKDQPIVLLEKIGRVGQFHRVLLHRRHASEGANHAVGESQRSRAAAGAVRVEQVEHLLMPYRRGHGNLRNVQVGEGSANAAGARHHAGDAETDVVGAFVADYLGRHAGHHPAFDSRRTIGVVEPAGERGQEPA